MGTEGRSEEGEKHKAEVGQKLGNSGLARSTELCWWRHRGAAEGWGDQGTAGGARGAASHMALEGPAGLGTSAGVLGC